MKPTYSENIKLLYMDTNSFIYEIKTDDAYADTKLNMYHYDTSEYAIDNVYRMPLVNKKVLGKMKDESKGNIITEFAGLRS